MKKALAVFLLFIAAFTLAADALDRLSSDLDYIERNFWLSLTRQKGEYREQATTVLNRFAAQAMQIQNFLIIKGLKQYGSLSGGARQLQLIYMNAKVLSVRRFSFSFKPTSFRAYQSEFNRLQKEKDAEESAASEEGGKKKKRSARKASVRAELKNVDLAEYERWLAEVTSANQEKFMKAKNNGSASEVRKMQDYANDYLTAIRQLRIVMAKIRQETDFKFETK